MRVSGKWKYIRREALKKLQAKEQILCVGFWPELINRTNQARDQITSGSVLLNGRLFRLAIYGVEAEACEHQ